MPSTYEPIATTTLSSTASSYTFTSIPSTYTDLILVASAANTSGSHDSILIQVGNGSIDTGNNYSRTRILWNGSSRSSASRSSAPNIDYDSMPPSSTNSYCVSVIQFQNYANTNVYKSLLIRNSNDQDYSVASIALWRSTSAINQIKIAGSATSFSIGTTFTLYGIKVA